MLNPGCLLSYRKRNQGIISINLFGLFLPHSAGADTELPVYFHQQNQVIASLFPHSNLQQKQGSHTLLV